MGWRRVRAKGGAPLKPYPKWRSLKEGDTVMEMGGKWEPCTLVAVKRFKQDWGNNHVVYWKHGLFLNLVTGATFWTELDDTGVRGEIVRAPAQDKTGIPPAIDVTPPREGS